MRAEFTNGATVHEMWNDLSDGRLVGAFSDFGGAKLFASAQLADDLARGLSARWYFVCDHSAGESAVYRMKADEAAS